MDFDISYGLIGLVLAGEGIGTLIADVPSGMIQRRFGNKQVMMMGLLVKSVFGAPALLRAFYLERARAAPVRRLRPRHVYNFGACIRH